MIGFKRSKTSICLKEKDTSGVPNYKKWGADWQKKLNKNSKSKFSWGKYNGKSVDKILIKKLRLLTKDHCSFCDKYAPEQDSDSIEHFKPKAQYPLFAYKWSNLFVACGGCQKRPKNWKLYAHKAHLVLKPDLASFQFDKYFVFDTKTGKILVRKIGTTPLEQEKAKLTIIYYQLNEFKRPIARLNQYKKYYDSSSPNHIRLGFQIDEMPYRFVYL